MTIISTSRPFSVGLEAINVEYTCAHQMPTTHRLNAHAAAAAAAAAKPFPWKGASRRPCKDPFPTLNRKRRTVWAERRTQPFKASVLELACLSIPSRSPMRPSSVQNSPRLQEHLTRTVSRKSTIQRDVTLRAQPLIRTVQRNGNSPQKSRSSWGIRDQKYCAIPNIFTRQRIRARCEFEGPFGDVDANDGAGRTGMRASRDASRVGELDLLNSSCTRSVSVTSAIRRCRWPPISCGRGMGTRPTRRMSTVSSGSRNTSLRDHYVDRAEELL